MPSFTTINDMNELKQWKDWTNSTKFNSYDRNIGDQSGREYKLIAKKEHSFSYTQRIKRGLLGLVHLCCSLGLAIFSKSTRNLFTKNKEVIRFGIILNKNEPIDKKIQTLSMGKFCMQSYPCQHDCLVTHIDGQQRYFRFNQVELKKLIKELPPENVDFSGWDKEHFVH